MPLERRPVRLTKEVYMSDSKNTRGGKTDDEIAEAAARANYLRKQGIANPPHATQGETRSADYWAAAAAHADNQFDGNEEASDIVRRRYRNAYLVARLGLGFGRVIKILGIITAMSLVVLGYGAFGSFGLPVRVACVFVGVGWGAVIYFLGVIIGAQAQMHYALLDIAVNTSPVLSAAEKAKVIIGCS